MYDSRAAATEAVSLFGCAGQQSDNGWRGLLEPAVPLGFVNAVRGGWRGSSAFISTFRDVHSCWPVDSAYLSLSFALSIVLLFTVNFLLRLTVYLCVCCSSSPLFLCCFLALPALVPIPFLRDSWEGLSGSILCCCFRLVGGFLAVSSHYTRVKGTYCLWITMPRDLRWIHTFAMKLIFKSVCFSNAIQAYHCSMCGKTGNSRLVKEVHVSWPTVRTGWTVHLVGGTERNSWMGTWVCVCMSTSLSS